MKFLAPPLMKFGVRTLLAVAFFSAFVSAATETLFSNLSFSVAEGNAPGELWVFSRGDVTSGVTRLNLKIGSTGDVQVESSNQEPVSDSLTAVQDGIFTDVFAERRRIPAIRAGALGLVYPMFGLDGAGRFLNPEGFFSVRSVDRIVETSLELPTAAEDLDSAMLYMASGFAFDSSQSTLWIANGALGLLSFDISKGVNDPKESRFLLNTSKKTLEPLKLNASVKFKKYTEIFDVALHPETGDLWLASAKGLWILGKDGNLSSASKQLDSMRVTGVWFGENPLQVIVETSSLVKESVRGNLWRRYDRSKGDFSKVKFLDLKGKAVKKDIYDNADYTVSDVAFVGKEAFVAVRAVGAMESGLLKIDSLGVKPYEKNEEAAWLYGFEMGVTDRDEEIVSLTSFPIDKKTMGLAVATYGNGISVSADTGKTWTPILNRAKLGGNLGSIRMVPSVIEAGGESLVSYKVSKDSKITIDVFSYDMRLVRTIVKSAPRPADVSRSTNAKEDVWDGLDDFGRPCTMGVYYVRVKDNHGHVGWGKVMTLGGNR